MYDSVLRGGLVVDPGNLIYGQLNVGILGGRIATVTDQKISGKQEFDCSGKIVAPGFVDIHAHEDLLEADCLNPTITKVQLRSGITTFLGGQCGIGPEDEQAYSAAYNQQGQPINCALLSGHGPLREQVGATDKYAPITDAQLAELCENLKLRLASGSYGLSISPRYIPGMDMREMTALGEVVQKFGGLLASHVRNDADGAPEAIVEFLEVGRKTGARLQVSHIGSIAGYGQMQQVLAAIDAAAVGGLDVAVDCYPYNAFCTAIGSATYDDGFLSRYGDDITKIEITDGEYRGRIESMEIFQKIRREHPEYLAIAHVMLPEDITMALRHPRVLLGSDGILAHGTGHPRAAGAFPRFIRQYVVEQKSVSLYDAIAKMTWLPAQRIGLAKGRLTPGWDADVVVFDLNTIQDQATFAEPVNPATGFSQIFIGGKLAVENDVTVDAHCGKFLRKIPGFAK